MEIIICPPPKLLWGWINSRRASTMPGTQQLCISIYFLSLLFINLKCAFARSSSTLPACSSELLKYWLSKLRVLSQDLPHSLTQYCHPVKCCTLHWKSLFYPLPTICALFISGPVTISDGSLDSFIFTFSNKHHNRATPCVTWAVDMAC